MIEILDQTLAAYTAWLDRQSLAAKTRVAYRFQVRQYGAYLAQRPQTANDPLYTPFARDYTVRDYKTYLKTELQAKPTAVNLALAVIDRFHLFIRNDQPRIQRESLPAQAPRALKPEEQKAFLRAIERTSSTRDGKIARLFFYTAVRLGERAALNLGDVCVSAHKGVVIIRSGKGDTCREIPLNTEVREALRIWFKERCKRFSQTSDPAAFLNSKGKRLSARSIDLIIRHIGVDAHLELSAHILRHSCLTNLVRRGNDLVLVAEIAGHKRLETAL